jgi:hypothetical protein
MLYNHAHKDMADCSEELPASSQGGFLGSLYVPLDISIN